MVDERRVQLIKFLRSYRGTIPNLSDFRSGNEWIKAIRQQIRKQGMRVRNCDLIALSRNNDPFFMGSGAHFKHGRWFTEMWEKQYDGQTGIHIRRVHYRLDAIAYPKLFRTKNTKRDWNYLCMCSEVARLLRLVPADAFDDHRNADPYSLHWRGPVEQREPITIDRESELYWNLPSFNVDLSLRSDWTIDAPRVDGYDPDDYLDRAYYLELWIEKSTMDDILAPLSRNLGIRLVTSIGFQSITNAVKLLKRVREIKKPARIFYISDHDDKGMVMPIAVARQIEYWRKTYAPNADIKLIALALTKEQITKHKLPYSIDNKNAVELDALEALHPGVLAKIVRDAVEPYLDPTVDNRLAKTKTEARQIIEDGWARLAKPHSRKLNTLRKRVAAVTEAYQQEIEELSERLERDLLPFQDTLDQLRAEVTRAASSFHPELPERPAQVETEQQDQDCLFDSSRDYIQQLSFYKAQAGK